MSLRLAFRPAAPLLAVYRQFPPNDSFGVAWRYECPVPAAAIRILVIAYNSSSQE